MVPQENIAQNPNSKVSKHKKSRPASCCLQVVGDLQCSSQKPRAGSNADICIPNPNGPPNYRPKNYPDQSFGTPKLVIHTLIGRLIVVSR